MSDIYRELKRNQGKQGYRYKQAETQAKQWSNRVRCQKLKMTDKLLLVIEDKLKMQWSPEQISNLAEEKRMCQP